MAIEEVVETVEVVKNGTEAAIVEAQAETKEAAMPMVAMVRKVLMAGVGVFALTKDEVEDFVTKLVERGEIAEHDGIKLIRDVLSRRRGEAEGTATRMQAEAEKQITKTESVIDQRIEGILARLNVPTKGDIDALSEKITLLAEKVDALRNA